MDKRVFELIYLWVSRVQPKLPPSKEIIFLKNKQADPKQFLFVSLLGGLGAHCNPHTRGKVEPRQGSAILSWIETRLNTLSWICVTRRSGSVVKEHDIAVVICKIYFHRLSGLLLHCFMFTNSCCNVLPEYYFLPCPNPHLPVYAEEQLSWVTPEMTLGACITHEKESAHHSLQSITTGYSAAINWCHRCAAHCAVTFLIRPHILPTLNTPKNCTI